MGTLNRVRTGMPYSCAGIQLPLVADSASVAILLKAGWLLLLTSMLVSVPPFSMLKITTRTIILPKI